MAHNSEIDIMAKALPNLTHLNLNCHPSDDCYTWAGFPSLVSLAEHCPNMRELSLTFELRPDGELDGFFPTPFQILEKLSVGFAAIEDPGIYTLFLSKMLPPTCILEYGYPLNAPIPNEYPEIERYKKNWEVVQKSLPIVIQARMEERRRFAGF